MAASQSHFANGCTVEQLTSEEAVESSLLWFSNLPPDTDPDRLETWARQQGPLVQFYMGIDGTATAAYSRSSCIKKILERYENGKLILKGQRVMLHTGIEASPSPKVAPATAPATAPAAAAATAAEPPRLDETVAGERVRSRMMLRSFSRPQLNDPISLCKQIAVKKTSNLFADLIDWGNAKILPSKATSKASSGQPSQIADALTHLGKDAPLTTQSLPSHPAQTADADAPRHAENSAPVTTQSIPSLPTESVAASDPASTASTGSTAPVAGPSVQPSVATAPPSFEFNQLKERSQRRKEYLKQTGGPSPKAAKRNRDYHHQPGLPSANAEGGWGEEAPKGINVLGDIGQGWPEEDQQEHGVGYFDLLNTVNAKSPPAKPAKPPSPSVSPRFSGNEATSRPLSTPCRLLPAASKRHIHAWLNFPSSLASAESPAPVEQRKKRKTKDPEFATPPPPPLAVNGTRRHDRGATESDKTDEDGLGNWTFHAWTGHLAVASGEENEVGLGDISLIARGLRSDLEFGDKIILNLDSEYITKVQKEMLDDPRSEVFLVHSTQNARLGALLQDEESEGGFLQVGVDQGTRSNNGKPTLCFVPLAAFTSLPMSVQDVKERRGPEKFDDMVVAVYLSTDEGVLHRGHEGDAWVVGNCLHRQTRTQDDRQPSQPSRKVVGSSETTVARWNDGRGDVSDAVGDVSSPVCAFIPAVSSIVRRESHFERGKSVTKFVPVDPDLKLREVLHRMDRYYVVEDGEFVGIERWIRSHILNDDQQQNRGQDRNVTGMRTTTTFQNEEEQRRRRRRSHIVWTAAVATTGLVVVVSLGIVSLVMNFKGILMASTLVAASLLTLVKCFPSSAGRMIAAPPFSSGVRGVHTTANNNRIWVDPTRLQQQQQHQDRMRDKEAGLRDSIRKLEEKLKSLKESGGADNDNRTPHSHLHDAKTVELESKRRRLG
ncbi:hypothetical protein HKX48_001391 [Thoreauomyces humboldtii]|nr:hypothetical protein HKX48_001391 [Thoreauomyces humboldtii]